jgi:hypothetical protein
LDKCVIPPMATCGAREMVKTREMIICNQRPKSNQKFWEDPLFLFLSNKIKIHYIFKDKILIYFYNKSITKWKVRNNSMKTIALQSSSKRSFKKWGSRGSFVNLNSSIWPRFANLLVQSTLSIKDNVWFLEEEASNTNS